MGIVGNYFQLVITDYDIISVKTGSTLSAAGFGIEFPNIPGIGLLRNWYWNYWSPLVLGSSYWDTTRVSKYLYMCYWWSKYHIYVMYHIDARNAIRAYERMSWLGRRSFVMCYLCDFGSDFIYGSWKWVSWFMIPPYSICDGLTPIDVCVISTVDVSAVSFVLALGYA